MLYVAYGSNIPSKHILSRCPSAKLYKTGYIKDYELVFNYHADIEPKLGSFVPCVIYDIDEIDFALLDLYEGYPKYYGRHYVYCKTEENGEYVKAIAYEMNIECKISSKPSINYVNCIRSGYKEYNLSEWYLDEALDKVGGIDYSIREKQYRY